MDWVGKKRLRRCEAKKAHGRFVVAEETGSICVPVSRAASASDKGVSWLTAIEYIYILYDQSFKVLSFP